MADSSATDSFPEPSKKSSLRKTSIKNLLLGRTASMANVATSLGDISISSSPKGPSSPLTAKKGLFRTSSLSNLRSKLINSGSTNAPSSWELMEQLANEPGFRYTMDQFKLIQQIGSGAYGKVLLCKHKLSGQKVVLKSVDKRHVKKPKHLQHLKDEREALLQLSHKRCPFVAHAVGSFQDDDNIYFVMEYVAGGELFAHLRSADAHRFKEPRAKFYAAELILALRHMHEVENIVYRDLKPENMLIDKDGHIKVIDFGFAKQLEDQERTYTFCGTLDYLAPEIIKGTGYGKEADFWSLGVLIYEMLCGHAPFTTIDQLTGKPKFDDIMAGKLHLPKFVTSVAQDLIRKLLVVDPAKRLGAGDSGGWHAVMSHPWFADIDWDKLVNKDVKPPKFASKGLSSSDVQARKNYKKPTEDGRLDDSVFADFDFVIRADGDVYEPNRSPTTTGRKLLFTMDEEEE